MFLKIKISFNKAFFFFVADEMILQHVFLISYLLESPCLVGVDIFEKNDFFEYMRSS